VAPKLEPELRFPHQSQHPNGLLDELVACGYGTMMLLVSAHSLIRIFAPSAVVLCPDIEVASLNPGLYCETVMKTRQPLLVPNAVRDEQWQPSPDIKLEMISYLGVPIVCPDGEVFGTICVLDKKPNEDASFTATPAAVARCAAGGRASRP
jgi:GAF domain-containing protein